MILWRFSQRASLDGQGGLFASGRWHTRGRQVLYCAPNPATALLEVMVQGAIHRPEALGGFRFLKIDLPDAVSMQRVEDTQLPPDWSMRLEVSRALGDGWLGEGRTLVLMVRSVLVPETYNLLVNPHHPEAEQLRLLGAYTFPLDPRLFGTGK